MMENAFIQISSIGRQGDPFIICYVRGSLPAVEIQLKYDEPVLFSAS